jgi:hypothetical protein
METPQMNHPGLHGRCLSCQAELTYVGAAPEEEITASGGGISVPLESFLYECPHGHGQFRIYISGAVKRFVKRQDEPGSR